MPPLARPVLALLATAVLAPAAWPHFNILLPQAAAARKGEEVSFLYRFGHPFEHELFDAPPPDRVFAYAPDGKRTDLTGRLEKIKLPGGEKKEVMAYRFRFTPEQRGDYTFVLHTPPIWLEEDREFVQDTVKVVLHVQAQKGWDADPVPEGFRMVPLTRPYGLQPGAVFQALVVDQRAAARSGALAGPLVEIERFNAARPAKLPPDEFRTLTAKTGPGGVVTVGLPEPGWWSLTAQRRAGQREHQGKTYPVRQRVTLWVWVDQKLSSK